MAKHIELTQEQVKGLVEVSQLLYDFSMNKMEDNDVLIAGLRGMELTFDSKKVFDSYMLVTSLLVGIAGEHGFAGIGEEV